MTIYEVKLTGPATVSTTYRVAAPSKEKAIAMAKSGDVQATEKEISKIRPEELIKPLRRLP